MFAGRTEGSGAIMRRLISTSVIVLCTAVLVGACGGDGDGEVDAVEAAQARVNAAQKDVDESQQAFEDASEEFCADSKQYITAIDRYGKVFDDRALTVGDVKTAGDDLVAPRKAVKGSADTLTSAGDELADAQRELTEAESALAAAQAGAASEPEPTTTTTAPIVSAGTIDRVEQAESDLGSASEGITD